MNFISIYSRVLGLLRPERTLAITLTLANLVLAGLQFLEPMLFGRVIDVLSKAAEHSADQVWRSSFHLLGLWTVIGISGIGANILVALHADRMAHRRRLAAMASFFEHVLALPLSYHLDTHSGRLIKTMLQGADNLFGIWLSFFREHLSTFIALLVLLPFSLFLNWRLASVLMALLLVFALLSLLVVRRTQSSQRQVQEFHSELAERAGDALGNISLIQSFVRLALEVRQLGEVMSKVLRAQYPVLTWWAMVSVLTRAASTLTVIIIFTLGTTLFLEGKSSVGEIVSFMGFATLLIGRLEQAMGFVSRLFFQMHSLGDFFGVLDATSAVIEKPDAIALGRVAGRVRFEQVTLSYTGERPAVSDLSFDVPAGSMVALVGSTGAGKSTAMALLHRLWDPQSGRITIDGIDIRDVTLSSLRANIGVVFQESTLFYRSIAENLRIGRPDASDAELIAAARLAEADDFILEQPQGYHTMVGERGRSLSGGERQRIGIARALLKDPPILILDEATSALDQVTEARVQKALGALMRGRTTFVIAHRLSTIKHADWVLVMEKGRIIEQGRYGELAAAGGAFSALLQRAG
jgi:ATP-binding cassette subfamily B protein